MTEERMGRRLAAILAADVLGYSRLVSADEADALSRLSKLRRDIIEPNVAGHSGRLFKVMGDGFLAEFASAVQAVSCALAIQTQTETATIGFDDGKKMRLRIGIHVGDVIVEGDDLMGDGVNIAARLESIAPPGGLLISRTVHDQVRDRIDAVFDDKGEIALKNIARPVQVFTFANTRSTPRTLNTETPALALPDKPSIAVLPFQNMSGDPEQDYFADGMVEDIITALSRFKSLFVIARNSSFTYKGKAVDIKQVGRELGVRYVLEGSVRKSGQRVRITGQLIEAATNRHIWADKFDGVLEEIFDLQDQVSSAVVARLVPKLEEAEQERISRATTHDPNSYDLFLQGMAAFYSGDSWKALETFESVIALDQKFAAAHAMCAASLAMLQARGGVQLASELQSAAIVFARQGASFGANDAFSLARSGHALAYLGREYDLGLSLLDRSIFLNPNLGLAWWLHGNTSVLCSEFDRAVQSYDRIMRLSPLDPFMPHILQGRSFALAGLDRYDEGYLDAVKSLQLFVGVQGLGALILNAVHSGRVQEAREAAERLQQLQPKFRLSLAGNTFHTKNDQAMKRLIEAYRKAGLPE